MHSTLNRSCQLIWSFSYTSVKPEKVNNPYGSTAGAGSGEFHVYRHARAREMERLRHLDEEEREKELDEQFASTVAKYNEEVEKKTAQRRKKRQRYKEAKMRKKNLEKAGIDLNGGSNETDDGAEEDDFDYKPNPTISNEEQKVDESSDALYNESGNLKAEGKPEELTETTLEQQVEDGPPKKKQAIEESRKDEPESEA